MPISFRTFFGKSIILLVLTATERFFLYPLDVLI